MSSPKQNLHSSQLPLIQTKIDKHPMASSQMNKVSYHARSISLPSTPHLITAQFDEQLCRLRSSDATSTSPYSSLTNRLTGLTELYGLVDELIQLPSQQSQSQIQSMLDGSLRFLDICSTSRDVLVQSKDRLQDIQSVFRRRCSGELNITSEAPEYLKARKTIKKTIKKCLKIINVSSKRDEANASVNDVEEITANIFVSLLSHITGAKSRTKWSAVAKLIHKKEPTKAPTSKFDAVDATLQSLVCQKKTSVNLEIVRNQMVTLESEIEQLDEILECLFRHLVKTRATLLNILSN